MKKKKYQKLLLYISAVLIAGATGLTTIYIVNKDKDLLDAEIAEVLEDEKIEDSSAEKDNIEEAKTQELISYLKIRGDFMDDFSKVEEGVYLSADSLQLLIVEAAKWKRYKTHASNLLPYMVRDVEFKQRMPIESYKPFLNVENEMFKGYDFIGIIQTYEYSVKIEEYKKGKGKFYMYTAEQSFWNCDWCDPTEYKDGENLTNQVIIR